MLVMKFGGSSVADAAQIAKVREIVASRRARRPLVVSSAHKGITDMLVRSAHEAARGAPNPSPVLERQRAIARSLGCDEHLLDPLLDELADLLRGLALVKELSPRSLDFVSSFGERMSVRCIADSFSRAGLPARAIDVWDLGFVTDDHFGAARPLPGYEDAVRRAYSALDPEVVPVVTGFIGKSASGEITTVGRNGSDLTATLLAAALGAEACEIWSDTDGVMTADPSVVKSARNIPTMRFDEAAELAYFGSRVLHPATLLPAMRAAIPVRVLNTNRPEHAGTVIEGTPPANPRPVTSIAYKEGQTVVTVRSNEMFGAAGFLARMFTVLGAHSIVVDMLATSEVSVSFTTDDRARLARAMPELEALGGVRTDEGRALVAIVGQHLTERCGLGAHILGAAARAAINVEMISYAMGSISFSLLVRDAEIDRLIPLLHAELCERDALPS